jgi:hypothetical protein
MGFEITKAGQPMKPRMLRRNNGNTYYVDKNYEEKKDGEESKNEDKKVFKNLSERMAHMNK